MGGKKSRPSVPHVVSVNKSYGTSVLMLILRTIPLKIFKALMKEKTTSMIQFIKESIIGVNQLFSSFPSEEIL